MLIGFLFAWYCRLSSCAGSGSFAFSRCRVRLWRNQMLCFSIRFLLVQSDRNHADFERAVNVFWQILKSDGLFHVVWNPDRCLLLQQWSAKDWFQSYFPTAEGHLQLNQAFSTYFLFVIHGRLDWARMATIAPLVSDLSWHRTTSANEVIWPAEFPPWMADFRCSCSLKRSPSPRLSFALEVLLQKPRKNLEQIVFTLGLGFDDAISLEMSLAP